MKSKLRQAEREYVQNELRSCQNASSKWKVIRRCVPRNEITQPVYTRDPKEVADEFNNFFVSDGVKASHASKYLMELHNLPPPPDTIKAPEIFEADKFQFHPVSTHEIRRIIMSFSSIKAPSHDKMTMSVIKDLIPCILLVLTDIVNRSLLSSVFPSNRKISEITPLLKEGDHEIANNNLPVSLLPVGSRVCERVAPKQLTTYMTNKERLTEHHSGNKKLHSCETLNVMMTDKVLEAMDAKKLVVLLDLSKAFDSLDHSRLLAKLKTLGVGCTDLEWIGSYFSGRQQYVRIVLRSHGVPQGSILGPSLFTIHINDLLNIPKFGSLESYVDDSKLYLSFSVKYPCSVAQQINDDLSKID